MESKPNGSSGVFWAGTSQVARVLIQISSVAILSRLLQPADFGIVAMASVFINFAAVLRDMGMSAAVVQRQAIDGRLLDTVFWFNVAVGLALAALALAIAVPFADAFEQPRLRGVVMVMSLSFPITCLGTVHQALLERTLEFRKLARIEISAAMLGLVAAILAAYQGAGVYSLVLSTLVTAAIGSLQLWLISPWRPTAQWSPSDFRSLWGFSGNLVGFQIVNYFARNADSMLIGRFLGAQDLGWYNMAYRIMLFPLQNLSSVVTRALFPVFSRQQDDHQSLRTMYLRTVAAVALITTPLMAGLWVLRREVVHVVLGPSWASVGDVLAWFAPVGLIQSLLTTVGILYMATGSTRTMMIWGLLASTVLVGGIAIGLHWGYLGVAAGYAIATFLLVVPGFLIPLRIVGLKFRAFIHAIARQIIASLIMGLAIWLLPREAPLNVSPTVYLAAQALIALAIYATAAWLLMKPLILLVFRGLTAHQANAKHHHGADSD